MASSRKPKPAGPQVRAYFAALPPASRRQLTTIRAAIRAAAPDAVEGWGYGIPKFTLGGKTLVWYAAWKNHVSLYPITPAIQRAHAAAVQPYKRAKGTIQFPMSEPAPVGLIKKLIKTRLAELRAAR